jgi:outer membrane protein assembly factor BamB
MFRRASLIAALACCLFVVPVASSDASVVQTDWAQVSGGATRHNDNTSETTITRNNVSTLTLQPGGFADDLGMPRPIISGGVVYTESHVTGGVAVQAWDDQTGTLLWATPPFSPTNDFAVSDGVLVVSDFFGSLNAYSTTDGSLLWSSPSGGSDAQPVIANDVVYVDYGSIQALDLHTGAILWTGIAITDTDLSGPTVWHNEVFQDTANSIYAFDTGDGHLLWSASCPQVPAQHNNRSPMVLHGIVYQDSVCAYDAVTGASIWAVQGFDHIDLIPDATGGRRIFVGYEAFVGSHGNYARVAAITRKTGATIWYHDLPIFATNPNLSLGLDGPVIANGLVYYTLVTTTGTIIKAYDTDTGKLAWQSQPQDGVEAISIADGRLWARFLNQNLVREWALP